MGRSSRLHLLKLMAALLVCAPLSPGRPRGVYPQNQRVVAISEDLTATVWVLNTLDNTANVNVEFFVLDGSNVVAKGTGSATIPPGTAEAIVSMIHVSRARPWSPDHPHLYELRTVVEKNAEAVEGAYDTEIRSVFGIRRIEIRGAELLLNGEPIHFAGVNRRGPGDWRDEELRRIREASLLFQRAGSEPAPTHLLDWADRNGLLIIEEAKSRQAVRSMVERDWNHPSVIAWSVAEPGATADEVKRLDNTRPVTVACSEEKCSADFLSIKLAGPLAAIGNRLEALHALYPGKPIFVDGLDTRANADGVEEYFSGLAKTFRQHSFVMGAAVATFEELMTPDGNLRPAYAAVRKEFSPLIISGVGQVDGVTRISVRNREEFPAVVARGYELRVGNQTQQLPDMKPGDRVQFDFHSVNPYRVEIVTASGFVVADQ